MSSITLHDILTSPLTASAADLDFTPDALGAGFGRHDIEMGPDPDGEAPVRCVLVRYRPDSPNADYFSRPAILFVHGMTDYFFQSHVARYFYDAGYAPYGIDLRKCGRSWREGQTWHHVTDQSLYDEDLSITHSLLGAAHPSVVVIGHSTGGLDVAMWARRLNEAATQLSPTPRQRAAALLHGRLSAVVLNSPWIGLQFDAITRAVVIGIIPALAKIRPHMPLPGGINPVYGRTLHRSEAGEWDYDLELKPLEPRKKYISWMAGVVREIQRLQRTPGDTGVPTLIMTSEKHHFSRRLSKKSYEADLILRPNQMWENARNVSAGASVEVCENAVHDIFLSPEPVRSRALDAARRWLEDVYRYRGENRTSRG